MKEVLQYWPIVLAIIGFIVWLVRLETKVKANSDSICDLKKENEDYLKELKGKMEALTETTNKIEKSLIRVIAYLEGRGIMREELDVRDKSGQIER